MRYVKVIRQMHCQGLPCGDAGTHAAGASARFAPIGAQIQACLAKTGLENQVADKVNRHTFSIGEQHAIP